MTKDSQLSDSDYSEYVDSDSSSSQQGDTTSDSEIEVQPQRKKKLKVLGAQKSKNKKSAKKKDSIIKLSNIKKFKVGFWSNQFKPNKFNKKTYMVKVAGEDKLKGLAAFSAFETETSLLMANKTESGGLYCSGHFDHQIKDGHKKDGIILDQDEFEDEQFQKKACKNGGTTIYVAFSGDKNLKDCHCGGWNLATPEYQRKWEEMNEEITITKDTKKIKASQIYKDADNQKVDMAQVLARRGVDPKSALMAINV